MASRSIIRIANSVQTMEGEGFLVHRPFPTQHLMDFDPFLLLDQMGPITLSPGQAKGAPDHPHRGFETVTYLLEGSFEHKDSQGNKGFLQAGDVQWMTAGEGVIHSEMPSAKIQQEGGTLHGFQLWVNLPKRDKMIRPRYQDVSSEKIPTATREDKLVWVKVIAGEALGKKAVIDTRTPIFYLHFVLQPGAAHLQTAPAEYQTFAYVISGEGRFGADRTAAKAGQIALFDKTGDEARLENPSEATSPLSVLLIGGVPLQEPVARYGPFVMNTRQEILQAIQDYQTGRMGRITG